jgi:hypothetical protein
MLVATILDGISTKPILSIISYQGSHSEVSNYWCVVLGIFVICGIFVNK